MYIPRIFKNENEEEVKDFIRTNSFGILVSQKDKEILATHIPIELEPAGDNWMLRGHVAKGNQQWKHFESGEEVMVIFHGPHAYVSSSWYNHINVPTWNYIAVHVYGKVQLLNEEDLLLSLKNLVNKYEKDSEHPFSMDMMPEEDLKKQLRGIVGFEILITKIEAQKKLSQNRNDEDYHNVIEKLENSEDANAMQTAKAMKGERGK